MLRLRFLVIQDPCGDVANHFLANVLLYGVDCNPLHLLIWLAVGIVISITGIYTVTRYEREYLKVV